MNRDAVVDMGNTAIKVGVFAEKNLVEKHVVDTWEKVISLLNTQPVTRVIVSSVSQLSASTACTLLEKTNRVCIPLLSTTPLPFANGYESKETIGTDRLAGIAGAYIVFPHSDCLVIDVGTAVKFDWITQEGIYRGGSISPGLKLRFSSLHTWTARLPLLEARAIDYLVGTTTNSCILSGIMNGMAAEINGLIARYREMIGSSLKVIATGGDFTFFETDLKQPIFVEPDLVLKGLHHILLHNI